MLQREWSKGRGRRIRVAVRLLPLVALGWAAAALAAGMLFIPGGEGDGPSLNAAVSADGRYVAFASDAANLVSDDDNGLRDVFLHDTQTGDTRRVSVAHDGGDADDASDWPSISADGRFVAYQSFASNLLLIDNNMEPDIYVYDRQTGATTRASLTSEGNPAAGASFEPAISADGRFVAFASTAINLDPADDDPAYDVFLHDRQTGNTELISFDAAENRGVGFAGAPALSADGRLVAFSSGSPDLVPNDDNGLEDIFVRDRQTGQTARVSVDSAGAEADSDSYEPALSADGRYVAFWSYAANLVGADTGGWAGVYVHDRQTGDTTLASRAGEDGLADGDSFRPRLSADGRYVVFESEATNLTGTPDTNQVADVVIHDRQTGGTALASVGAAGPGDGESLRPAISADGGHVAFHSDAANLVTDDTNEVTDVFLRDLVAGETARVSLAAAEAEPLDEMVFLSFVVALD